MPVISSSAENVVLVDTVTLTLDCMSILTTTITGIDSSLPDTVACSPVALLPVSHSPSSVNWGTGVKLPVACSGSAQAACTGVLGPENSRAGRQVGRQAGRQAGRY